METRVQKWGNIILEVKGKKRYSLRQLLAKVTRKNLHGEFESGPPLGKEIW